jgi:hypothetical protein
MEPKFTVTGTTSFSATSILPQALGFQLPKCGFLRDSMLQRLIGDMKQFQSQIAFNTPITNSVRSTIFLVFFLLSHRTKYFSCFFFYPFPNIE